MAGYDRMTKFWDPKWEWICNLLPCPESEEECTTLPPPDFPIVWKVNRGSGESAWIMQIPQVTGRSKPNLSPCVLVAQLCLTLCDPWTVAHQAPLSMEFSRQEYWSGLPCPSPGNLPNPGIKPRSPTLQADSLLFELPAKPNSSLEQCNFYLSLKKFHR